MERAFRGQAREAENPQSRPSSLATCLCSQTPIPVCPCNAGPRPPHGAGARVLRGDPLPPPQDSGHPCTAADPDSCFMPVSPQHFIDLFKF